MARIILTMIVKDEEPVIRRALASVKPHISAWVIGDTGSTDGTKSVVQDALQSVPGTLIDVPWTDDFAEARNTVREAARTLHGDDCMFLTIDADEELNGSLPEILNYEAYSTAVIQDDGRQFNRTFLAKPQIQWEYPLHEVLASNQKVDLYRSPMLRACHIRSYSDGHRSRNMEAATKKDLEILRRWVEREPREGRAYYYLGHIYLRIKDYANAKRALHARLSLDPLDRSPELRHAALLLAFATHASGECPLKDLLYACQMGHPSAWGALGAWLNDQDLPAVAVAVLEHGKDIYRSPDEHYPPDDWTWDDEISQALARDGKRGLAASKMIALSCRPELPADAKQRILKNLEKLNGPSNHGTF